MAIFVNLRENIYFRLSMRKMMEKVGLDRKGFDTLFELYYGELTYFVYSFVNDKEVAKDLVHDLFLNLWQNRRQIDPSLSVKSYLFRIARNYAFNYLKHLKVIATNERDVIETYELAGQDTEELESRLERVRRLFEKLPEKQKEVVFKCCIEGKLYPETAQEMQISENTVKTHLLRAMKFFRQELRGDIILLFMLVKRRLK